MLGKIIQDGSLEARGVVGFYRANSVGDDIQLFDDKTGACIRSKANKLILWWKAINKSCILAIHGLRQQAEPHETNDPCYCLSDFVAPLSTGKEDFIGMFAVSVGFGCEKLCTE
jgi:5-methyltetrahydrofolate--homocysteine methyltransferase